MRKKQYFHIYIDIIKSCVLLYNIIFQGIYIKYLSVLVHYIARKFILWKRETHDAESLTGVVNKGNDLRGLQRPGSTGLAI